MAPFQTIDHTGDAGLIVRGQTLEELFVDAAAGMFCILAGDSTVDGEAIRRFEVTGEGWDGLLRAWLAELNYGHITRHELYADFRIERLEPGRLTAACRSEALNPERHRLETEIKAVTWHQLAVTEVDGGWEARVIFDL